MLKPYGYKDPRIIEKVSVRKAYSPGTELEFKNPEEWSKSRVLKMSEPEIKEFHVRETGKRYKKLAEQAIVKNIEFPVDLTLENEDDELPKVGDVEIFVWEGYEFLVEIRQVSEWGRPYIYGVAYEA